MSRVGVRVGIDGFKTKINGLNSMLKLLIFAIILFYSSITSAQPIIVSVLGDSMAHPIGVQLQEIGRRNAGSLLVHRNAFGSSGLVQNDIINWRVEGRRILERQSPNIVIIVLGTNDAIGIENYAFDSDGWSRLYSQRVSEMLDIAQRHSRFVYWVGVPPMRNQNFSNRIFRVNQVISNVINNRRNVQFFDTWQNFYGLFVEFSEGRRIRETDGIHYTHAGARQIAERLAFIIVFQLNSMTFRDYRFSEL